MIEQVKKIILELQAERNIPQFLFSEVISASTAENLRMSILKFKEENTEENKIDFIINSPGGDPHSAYRIIRLLRDNFKEVNIIIPFWAKSAATLLSLGGTSIIMDEFGEFGPLDMQVSKETDDGPDIKGVSALIEESSLKIIENRAFSMYKSTFTEIYNDKSIKIHKKDLSKQVFDFVSSFYTPLLAQINPYTLGEKQRHLDLGLDYALKILVQYNNKVDDSKNEI